ncbi:MAG: endonuclease/exonuclease/phosphatase family protein [Candidatus Binataceae bacterium]
MKDSAPGHHDVTVMTMNVYLGVELGSVFAARDFPELIDNVAGVWAHVQRSDIPARAVSLAREIAAAAPDLLGLQEIVQWSVGTPGAMLPRLDFLSLILEALRNEGAFYAPIAIRKDLDQAAPLDMNGNFLRFEDRHALLLRIEPPPTQVRPYDIQAQTFTTLLERASPIMGSLRIPRSSIAVDAMVGDRKFRIVESHIESMHEAVQLAQARELIAAHADTALPIIMLGDFNSNANQQPGIPDNTPTYPELIAAGFQDTWAALNQDDFGNTCCQAPDLRNSVSELNRRLDLILTRGAITPISAKLVGADPAARTPWGVWPSDHAAVVAKLRFE